MTQLGRLILVSGLAVLLASGPAAGEEERFPPPDFDSGYRQPTLTTPPAQAAWRDYTDVAVLLVALSLASYLALWRRSRRGVVILGIFSLAYFGFWREGCVCSIGSIQNVTLSLFDVTYAVPLSVIAFFFLPLIFTLLFGRVFCAAVCPHGALQDLVLLWPVKVPLWLEHGLRLFAYIYLGLAVLFAATDASFIICQYDPFIPIFRLTGELNMIVLGACFLGIGVFVGRPYCRYVCPYGVLLGLVSSVSKWRISITPDTCTQCRLCEESCPFNAIRPSSLESRGRKAETNGRRLAVMMLALPVIVALGVWLGGQTSTALSRGHETVELAERIYAEEIGQMEGTGERSEAFRGTGRDKKELYAEGLAIQRQFKIGGRLLGGWIGLVIALKLLILSTRRKRTDYEVDQVGCLACARCYLSCPNEHTRLQQLTDTSEALVPANV